MDNDREVVNLFKQRAKGYYLLVGSSPRSVVNMCTV
jgi:hypothetical protein